MREKIEKPNPKCRKCKGKGWYYFCLPDDVGSPNKVKCDCWQEQIQKPPVLSILSMGELAEKLQARSGIDHSELLKLGDLQTLLEGAMFIQGKAQRDALVAYYEPLIQQTIEEWQDKLVQRDVGWLKQKAIEIQQAKAEVAREIFEEIDCQSELIGEGLMGEVHLGKITWQSLKAKYPKKEGK